ERRPVALLYLTVHVFAYLVHRYVPRPLDESLHVLRPRPLHQLAHSIELGELRPVVGVADGSRTQPVAERERHVVLRANVADIVEVLVKKALPVVRLAPLRNDTPPAADHTAQTVVGILDILQPDAAVDGEVIDALFALLYQRVAEQLPRQLLGPALYLFHGLVHGHRSHRHGTVADYPFARLVNVVARGEVHQRIAAPFAAPH